MDFKKEVTKAQIIDYCRILMEFGFTQIELRSNRVIFEQRTDGGLEFSVIDRWSGYFFKTDWRREEIFSIRKKQLEA